MPIDIFISHKSADVKLAKQLYNYLAELGFEVFESDESLPLLGSADYRKEIDKALDECKHLIVVGSAVENIQSSWVEAEWGFFINEKRSGRKQGNLITVITENLKIDELPASLRNYEVIYFEKSNFPRIAQFMGSSPPELTLSFREKLLKTIKKMNRAVMLVPFVLMAMLAGYLIFLKTQPFDSTIILKPVEEMSANPYYPKFENGELSIYPSNKVETKQVVANQEIVFKQIPASLFGKKVLAKLYSDFWKLSNDTVVLDKEITLKIIPNGKLADIFGNIIDAVGNPIDSCKVLIGTDTNTYTNSSGVFRIKIPATLQKQQYFLLVSKEGYLSQRLDYFGGSGNIDILLKRK